MIDSESVDAESSNPKDSFRRLSSFEGFCRGLIGATFAFMGSFVGFFESAATEVVKSSRFESRLSNGSELFGLFVPVFAA